MNTPNKLTLLRLILVVPFLILIGFAIHHYFLTLSYEGETSYYLLAAGGLFIFAMITDALDGYLARKNNQITTFGKLFDPIADKFMTTAAFISLAILNLVPFWVVIIFVLRDIFVDGIRNLAATNNIKVAASNWGKIKTVIQTIALVLIFFVTPYISIGSQINYLNPDWKIWLLNIPVFFALIASLIGGYQYFKNIKQFIKTK